MKKRVTVYLDEELHRILKLRAAHGGSSVSETLTFAIESFLFQDAEEQSLLDESRRQAARGETIPYEEAVAKLRRDGLF
ncbi:MAG TPA: CopG family transcriptional regulator [Thermoanaerobaculia bacterium]|nr:CopG family transcriptional regulator [Thermoanaerobaculia bacterium]